MRRFICLPLILCAAALCAAQVPASKHVFVIAEENQNYSSVIGNSSLPYINSLAQKYALATNYYGNTHPSIGNYFMMTTGQIYTNDDNYAGPLPSSVDNIVRRALTAGKTWKSYAEGLPEAGYTGGNTGSYYKRHNPFAYLSDVANSSSEKMNLVNTDQLLADLANDQVPDLSFIVPNGMNDGHDGTPQQMDNWLSQYVPKILASKAFQDGGILFITFDESSPSDVAHGGGKIVTVVVSPNGKNGYKSTTFYQHQSLLKSMLMALGLNTNLGAAGSAPDMGEFFNSSTTNVQARVAATTTGGSVAVSSPVNGSYVSSPVRYVASANGGGKPITAMRIYVDGQSAYTVNAASLNTSLAMSSGSHSIVVQAWNSAGQVFRQAMTVKVGSSSATIGSGVKISSPTAGTTAASPVPLVVSATPSSGRTITAMRVYVDSQSVYAGQGNSINTRLAMGAGKHSIVVNAWDNAGAVYVSPATTINVNSLASPVPAPAPASGFDSIPSNAVVLNHLENPKWYSCNCGGTGSQPSSQGISQSSNGLTFNLTGAGNIAGWLWYTPFASTNASHWIMDYDVTPVTDPKNAVALEFDGNQTGSRGNYVIGTECNYGYNPSQKTVWRFWTMSGGRETWGTTSYACPITQVNHTYHVQMHFVIGSGQYQVAHVKVTDRSTGAVVQDAYNLGTFYSVGGNTGHGNSIDIQGDVAAGKTQAVRYQNITIARW